MRIRTFSGGYPLLTHDVTTGSNRVAAEEAAARALEYLSWDDVQVDFGDGSRPLRGRDLLRWVRRHFPECLRRCDRTTVCVLDYGHGGQCQRPGGVKVVATADVDDAVR